MFKFYANIIIFVLTFTFSVKGQNYPKNIFRSPIDMGHYYSGTFGELRPNHFHSGVDLATLGKQGLPVYTAAAGWVSRIKVSGYGYGYAVYVSHPNGYTTVYGHLKSYSSKIADYVLKKQYEQESFEVDLYLDSTILPVSENEVIAYSGNSGSSQGPHVHFEVRDTKTEETINPLLFGLEALDTIAPTIGRIKIYPNDVYSFVDHKNLPKIYKTIKDSSGYSIQDNDTVDLFGNTYFGIETWDRLNRTTNKNGIYLIKVFVDDTLYYLHRLDKFSFKDTRFINDHIDYAEFMKTGSRFQTTKISDGNNLCIYQFSRDNGVISFTSDQMHSVLIRSCDVSGNCADLRFIVRSSSSSLENVVEVALNPSIIDTLYYNTLNIVERENIKIVFPTHVLHDNLFFEYYSFAAPSSCFSKVHHIHNIYTPINDFVTVSIIPSNLPEKYRDKALLVKVGSNDHLSSAGGEWKDGAVTSKIKVFGNYAVSVDTIAPLIKPINIFNGKKISKLKQKQISFKIGDNLSGIAKYRATLNGNFILMEMEGKTATITCEVDDKFLQGENAFELHVVDNKGNESIFKALVVIL